MFDLTPSARRMSRLVAGVRDDQLADPTPCTEWSVADLLGHIHQFSSVFTSNARKEPMNPPHGLVEDWRHAIPSQLDALADAWTRPSAWEGRVSAGGIEMAAPDNALVGVEELTTHGWDLATATGQQFDVPDDDLDHVDRFVAMFSQDDSSDNGPFGPVAAAPADASRLQRAVAVMGRDPLWSDGSAR